MDVTPGITALIPKLPSMIQALTDAGKADEATMLASVQQDLTQLINSETVLVSKIVSSLGTLLDSKLTELQNMILSLKITNTTTFEQKGTQ